MDATTFKKDIDRLNKLKTVITDRSFSKVKYAMNNLSTAIDEAVTFLQNLRIPPELEETKQSVLSEVQTAQAAFQQEYARMPLPHLGKSEVISEEAIRQADRIRNALRTIDAAGLRWVERNG